MCILPLTLLCQLSGFSKAKKFALGLVYSPDYCYRVTTSDPSFKPAPVYYNSIENPKIGFTAGLNFLWKLNTKFSVEAGVMYSDKGYQTKTLQLSEDLPRNYPEPLPGDQSTASFVYHYRFMDVPLKVSYYILNKEVKLFLSGGLSGNFFLGETDTYSMTYRDGHSASGNTTPATTFSMLNLSIVAGFGISFHISKKLLVRIEPIYRQGITPFSDSPLKDYLYSAVLNTGLYYRF